LPSLLPKFRGASPISSAILSGDEESGTTIMLMDAQMDHGPILAQEKADISDIPKASELGEKLMRLGGKMLIPVIKNILEYKQKEKEQEHNKATFTKKISKEDGLIDLSGDPMENLRKIRAFDIWPRTYFFKNIDGKDIRIVIAEAHTEEGVLVLDKVIPEGKKEVSYGQFTKDIL